jgi:hypothetical protein
MRGERVTLFVYQLTLASRARRYNAMIVIMSVLPPSSMESSFREALQDSCLLYSSLSP